MLAQRTLDGAEKRHSPKVSNHQAVLRAIKEATSSSSSDPDPTTGKRKRREDDVDCLPQMNLGGKSISVIWNEYTSTLKARDDGWRTGSGSAQRLYRRKVLYYLEIARQSELCGGLEAAR